MKKHRLAILVPVALLVFAVIAAGIWYARAPKEPEPPEETTTQPYPITPDEEYYPEGYIGYRYPVRPGLEIWGQFGYVGPGRLNIPEDVIAGMTTEELAQSVVCYPWYGWQGEMMLSSQSEQPADFVRGWFDRRYSEFPAMQALAKREDARAELEKLDEMYAAFAGPGQFNGIDPQLMLQSAQFGGDGIPDDAHKH